MTTPLIAGVLQLDRRCLKELKVTDPYSLHRVVYSLFDDVRSASEKKSSVSSGILWADQGGDFHGRRILFLSDREPASQEFGKVAFKPIRPDFLKHNRYRFKVIINPTRRDNTSRKLIPVKGRDQISQWFMQCAFNSWGFKVTEGDLQINKMEVMQFKDKSGRLVTLAQTELQGSLTVIDDTQFKHSFCAGIGRGRAFGCGLLQIVPLIDNPFSN